MCGSGVFVLFRVFLAPYKNRKKIVFHVSFWPQTARNTVFHVSLCARRRETQCFMFHNLGRETASGDDWLNLPALLNIENIVVTFETSHPFTSPLKEPFD